MDALSLLRDWLRYGAGQRGQTMAEYAVLLAIITVVVVAALASLALGIGETFERVVGILP